MPLALYSGRACGAPLAKSPKLKQSSRKRTNERTRMLPKLGPRQFSNGEKLQVRKVGPYHFT